MGELPKLLAEGSDWDLLFRFFLCIISGCGYLRLFPSDTRGGPPDDDFIRHRSMYIRGYHLEQFHDTFYFCFVLVLVLFLSPIVVVFTLSPWAI